MSTANFITQDNFELYVTDYQAPTAEELIKDEIIEDESSYYSYLELDQEIFWDDFQREFEAVLKDEENKLKKPLNMHEIELKGGYYSGAQLYVKTDEDMNPEELDNDDCHYYWGECRSRAIREYRAEVKRVEKLLLNIAKRLHMARIGCAGVFSNGEAVYCLEKQF